MRADIVHQHALRKDCRIARASRQVAAHRQIEDEEKWVVIYPWAASREIGGCPSCVQVAIHVETNRLRFPLDREKVELVAETSFRKVVAACYRFAGGVSRAMYASRDLPRC